MALWLNAHPLTFDDRTEIPVCAISYDQSTHKELKEKHRETHTFYRTEDKSLCFSTDGNYPITGENKTLIAKDNLSLMSFLIKDGVVRLLRSQNRNMPVGFNPIEIVSTRDSDNIINEITSDDFPFALYQQINAIEKHLSENVTHVLKFFLHISKDEQLERFKDRLDDPAKHWKISESDYTERERWEITWRHLKPCFPSVAHKRHHGLSSQPTTNGSGTLQYHKSWWNI